MDMEQHHIEFMKKNYKDYETRTMTERDIKMANMIKKIQNKYASIYEARSHTILIEKTGPVLELQKKREEEVKKKPDTKLEKKITTERLCKAIVISTNKECGRRIKNPGCEFCGIHNKKK